ncbi:prolipoprotein diacylglyceryl transferase [Cerasicoccus fimbriatus]|uniref:prolipoprotein diacylglyceryl transferase n=1 Tax=Cerasicoccus fimbriatus TaxID=3014554 RepID=UPI0022B38277|nr:prolipoprotein diacylglyceryl transferase [Cerasicoccus sp. TK19100]
MTLAQLPPAPDTGYHVHDFDPFLLRFPESWPIDGLRWYGLAYVAAFALAFGLLRLYYKRGRSPYNPEQQADLLFAVILGTLLGGRLGYFLLYRFDDIIQDPLLFLRVWEGGMASHGGMVGIVLGMAWFARKSKTSFWQVADIICTLGPPGVFFGRLANFINGELYGRPTDVPWAYHFLDYRVDPLTGYGEWFWTPPVHPSQLYQAGMEGLLLTIYLQARFWLSTPGRRPLGQLAGEFLIGYAILRILGEVFREPDASLIFGLSRGSFYSLFMIIAGVAIITLRRKAKQTNTLPDKVN